VMGRGGLDGIMKKGRCKFCPIKQPIQRDFARSLSQNEIFVLAQMGRVLRIQTHVNQQVRGFCSSKTTVIHNPPHLLHIFPTILHIASEWVKNVDSEHGWIAVFA